MEKRLAGHLTPHSEGTLGGGVILERDCPLGGTSRAAGVDKLEILEHQTYIARSETERTGVFYYHHNDTLTTVEHSSCPELQDSVGSGAVGLRRSSNAYSLFTSPGAHFSVQGFGTSAREEH